MKLKFVLPAWFKSLARIDCEFGLTGKNSLLGEARKLSTRIRQECKVFSVVLGSGANVTVAIICKKSEVQSLLKQLVSFREKRLSNVFHESDDLPSQLVKQALQYYISTSLSSFGWMNVKDNVFVQEGFTKALVWDYEVRKLHVISIEMSLVNDNTEGVITVTGAVHRHLPVIPDKVAWETSQGRSYPVFVLPSLKPAIVIKAHDTLPGGFFKSYNDLQAYWLDQFGYILPDGLDRFYSVKFTSDDSMTLTYPACCVWTHDLNCEDISLTNAHKTTIEYDMLNTLNALSTPDGSSKLFIKLAIADAAAPGAAIPGVTKISVVAGQPVNEGLVTASDSKNKRPCPEAKIKLNNFTYKKQKA